MQGRKKESSHQHKCCLSWSSEDESLAANTELTTFYMLIIRQSR